MYNHNDLIEYGNDLSNDAMRSVQTEGDVEKEFQLLLKVHDQLESKFDSHDCKDISCSTCLDYNQFCEKYIYE